MGLQKGARRLQKQILLSLQPRRAAALHSRRKLVGLSGLSTTVLPKCHLICFQPNSRIIQSFQPDGFCGVSRSCKRLSVLLLLKVAQLGQQVTALKAEAKQDGSSALKEEVSMMPRRLDNDNRPANSSV